MFLVALTGNIGSGKSTVANIIQKLGHEVVDADEIARKVVEPGQKAYKEIREAFGSEYFDDAKHELKRDKLNELIFADAQKRKRLNAITHPEIRKKIIWRIVCSGLRLRKFVILDIPLLFETGSDRFMQKTIVVSCHEDVQLRRVMLRDKIASEEALRRIRAQMPMQEKTKRATCVIDNNGTVEETEVQVLRVLEELEASWIPAIVRSTILFVISFLILKCLL